MKSPRNSRRTAVALAISTTVHVVILALLLSQAAPDYQLPESVAPPMDVKIIPEPPPRPVIIERLPPLKPPPTKAPPTPPKPASQPQPQPQEAPPAPPAPVPTPPVPAPPKPTPQPPKPPLPTPAKPLPAAVPRPETKPAPTPTPPLPQTSPAPPTPRPPTPPAPPAPPSPPAPMHLNIHKPEKEAPGNIATLPFAPAPSAPPGGPTAPAAASAANGEPALGGSRLNGLSPYPYGVMPNGGGGLRGTLIGCANAEAVSLTSAERARCNERFGSEAASAPAIDSMSPTKRAGFDKAAERQDRSLQYRDSTPTARTANHPLSPDGTSRGPGSVIAAEPPQ